MSAGCDPLDCLWPGVMRREGWGLQSTPRFCRGGGAIGGIRNVEMKWLAKNIFTSQVFTSQVFARNSDNWY